MIEEDRSRKRPDFDFLTRVLGNDADTIMGEIVSFERFTLNLDRLLDAPLRDPKRALDTLNSSLAIFCNAQLIIESYQRKFPGEETIFLTEVLLDYIRGHINDTMKYMNRVGTELDQGEIDWDKCIGAIDWNKYV